MINKGNQDHFKPASVDWGLDEQLARIERALAEMDGLGNRRDEQAVELRTTHNAELHSSIVAAARSPRLPQLLHQLVSVNAIARNFGQYSADAVERSQRQHHDIVDAIRWQNAELARAAMTTHLLTAAEVLADVSEPVE